MDGLSGCLLAPTGLYVGNLQVLWAVSWQRPFGLYVGNLQVLWALLGLSGYCWHLQGLYVGNLQVSWGLYVRPALWGLYVGNLQVLWAVLGVCWQPTHRAVCWQPTGLMRPVLATYSFTIQAVCWQPTGLIGLLGTYSLWGCMLATYRSYGPCWNPLGLYVGNHGVQPVMAVCWQPTALWGLYVEPTASLALYVGNLQVLCPVCWAYSPLGLYVGNLQPLWRSVGTYSPHGAVCWQPTALMGPVVANLQFHRLSVGNLQPSQTAFGAVCWQPTGVPHWTVTYGAVCWQPTALSTYRSWAMLEPTALGAVCWQPTGLIGLCWTYSLGLYVGNLQVMALCVGKPTAIDGPVCCQPTGPSLYVGNLHVSSWALHVEPTAFGAVCWQPTALMGPVCWTWPLGLYVGNLQVLYVGNLQLEPCCRQGFHSPVCWQPTALMGLHVGQPTAFIALYVGNLQVLMALYVGNLQPS